MSRPSRLTAAMATLTVATAAVLAVASPAFAHVGASGDIAPGGFGTVTFTVPNERDDASTTKFEVKIEEAHPLGSLRVQPKAGWTVTTTTRTVAEPIEVFGSPVTEVVDTITWQTDGAGIGPDQFEIRGGPFPEDVESVAFPTIQTYSSGEEVGWIEPVVEGEDEPEHPTPVLVLAGETSSGDQGASADDEGDDDGTDALAVVALVVAIAALALGGAGFAASRRRST